MQDNWKLILTEEEVQYVVKRCADYINQRYKGEDVVVACILKGAVYFHVDLTRYLEFPHASYFIEATSYYDGQKQSEELKILSVIHPDKFKGKVVILLDELFDNGKTLYNVKNKIQELGQPKEIFTCVAFRKEKSTKYPLPDMEGILVPDVWLVGYGLDSCQKHRNLREIYACPKIEGIPKSEADNMFEDDEYYELCKKRLKTDR